MELFSLHPIIFVAFIRIVLECLFVAASDTNQTKTTMTIQNAIKKLEKSGFSVAFDGNRFSAKGLRQYIVSFYRNGSSDQVTCIGVHKEGDECDSQTDYFPVIYCDNITRAIKLAL